MQRDNIRYIVTYTTFIILFVLGAVFYKQPFFSVLVLLLFVLPIISIYITSRLKDKLIISAEFIQHSIVAGNKAEMTVSVDNPTLFSFLNINLDYKAGILFYPNDINGRLSLSAPLKRKNRVCFTYSTLYPGMFEIFIYNATVTDPLHLHTFMLNCDITLHLPVYPEHPAEPWKSGTCCLSVHWPGLQGQRLHGTDARCFCPWNRSCYP